MFFLSNAQVEVPVIRIVSPDVKALLSGTSRVDYAPIGGRSMPLKRVLRARPNGRRDELRNDKPRVSILRPSLLGAFHND